jgi:hypothetical protein
VKFRQGGGPGPVEGKYVLAGTVTNNGNFLEQESIVSPVITCAY